jgi:glycosyltransferase involved in cell wall biosynthesis
MTTCQADEEFLRRLHSNLRPIALGSSDWANPEVFVPLEGTEKAFDAVMIARWRVWKRHHVLFRALRRIGDRRYRVALAAAPALGRSDREAILDMIGHFGLGAQITVFEHLSHPELNVVLNRSKVNVLLSRQEGGNRGLCEGFFAGVPGLALKGHLGVVASHFNRETGRLIDEADLAETLLEFRERWRDFNPRPWALANVSPEISTRRLNDELRQLAAERHEPWTRDIVAKCNAQELEYFPSAAGSGLTTMEELLAENG